MPQNKKESTMLVSIIGSAAIGALAAVSVAFVLKGREGAALIVAWLIFWFAFLVLIGVSL